MNRIETLHSNVFSQKNVELFEKNIMFLAIGGFIVHLLLIFFAHSGEGVLNCRFSPSTHTKNLGKNHP